MSERSGAKWSFVLDEPTRILLADDDPILREFAKVHLATPVASIETAADGEEAWTRLTADSFDLALVDIDMPKLDGFALLERIRAEAALRHLPIVMITGREDVASIDRAYELGASSFATKPVNWRQLSHQLRYVLRTSRMQAELRAARDRAEKASAVKSNMVATLAHEFRTPLSSIIGFSELLRASAQELSPEQREFAGFVNASGQQLLEVLGEVLAYSRLVSGDCAFLDDDHCAFGLIEAAIQAVELNAINASATITFRRDTAGAILTCDRDQVVRMIRHLLDNAVVHGAGPVEVDARALASGEFQIDVRDQGPGIPADRLETCFEPFGQADMSLARSKSGLGIGLSIVKQIADLHDVQIENFTGTGCGMTMRLIFPAARVCPLGADLETALDDGFEMAMSADRTAPGTNAA